MTFENGVLAVRGVDVAYRSSGPAAGLPVVLIHGWASSGRMWSDMMGGLAQQYRCVALDLPGHGDSARQPLDWFSLENLTAVVGGICDRLGLRHPVLMGHSMGGTLALDLAAGRPDLPARVVAINPVIMGSRVAGGAIPYRVARPFAGLTRRVWPMATRILRGAPSSMGKPWPNTFRRWSEDAGRTTADAAVGTARAILRTDLTPRLSTIRVPALILIGERDRTVPPQEGRMAADAIPNSQLVSLPAGHHPQDDLPQACLDAVREFLVLAQAA